ncbi:MAG: hypothetical protein Q4D38_11575 [Planctomycetia bacterium]|nr:hypothetical protein [Planctomycetia bacterium]
MRRFILIFALVACASAWAVHCEKIRAEGAATDSASDTRVRLVGDALADAVKNALKKWQKTPNDQAEAAAEEFLALYGDLRVDEQMNPRLRGRLTKSVASKLSGLSRQISRNLERPVLGQMDPGFGGAAGSATDDKTQESGEKLVEVIESTIRPDSWESRGGSGTIRYWNTGRHLIIRQTDEAHEEIQSLLEQLRRAGS